MNYTIIIRPIIGAVIGYVTNWIAVKMLFRPLNPIKIGKIKLPFTPGIIPKNKERIAKAIGDTISNNLLTEDAIVNSLLSEEKEKIIKEKIEKQLTKCSNENSIKENILKIVEEDTYSNAVNVINDSLADNIVKTLKEENIGNMIASQIEIAAKEKMQGSMLRIFGINSIISNISSEVSIKINEYIDANGKEIVSNIINKKIDELEETKVSAITRKINDSEIDVVSIIMNIYNKIMKEKLTEILKAINISNIVTDKINSMDMLELEKLILTIMKKELNSLVNLGALIGFVLGLLNLMF
ncbi:MAG: DUF445 family protein [Clostridia bacterium]|nr:DUF445 family protein [Clostridia bacterium]